MIDVIFVSCLAIWAAGVGLAILNFLAGCPEHRLDPLALAIPLGLGILALSAVGLGEIGHLDRSGIGLVFLLGTVPAIRGFRRFLPGIENPFPRPSRLDLGFDVPLILTLLGTFLTALAPVTDGDALCYHLQVPKIFLHAKSMTFDPDLHETIYPLVAEMLYAIGLAFRGPISCRLIQWVLGLCLAANVTALARPILGGRARWAGTIALLVPAVSNGMGAPLNDVALATFGNASLVAYLGWKDRPSIGRATLTGILAGQAVGVKYPALAWAGLIGILIFLTCLARKGDSSLEDRIKSSLIALIAFAGTTLLIGGVWYLRAYVHTGNPVYPFFRSAFGGAGIDDVLDPIKRPMPVTPWDLLTAIGPMTLQPDRFDSFSHQFGPIFLLFAPALLLLRSPARLREITGIGLAFLTLCLTQRQSMRFVLTAIGPLSVAAAWAISEWSDRRTVPARCLVAIAIAILFFEASIALGRARHGLSVAMGRESAEAYLSRREPAYRVGLWIGANLPESARIVGQEHRGFYIPRSYNMELAHRRRTGLGTHGETGDQLVKQLRSDGFSHLLLCPPEPETAVEFDPTLSRGLKSWLSQRIPLYERAIVDPDGVTRRYRIYDLNSDAAFARSRRPPS